MKIHHWTLCVGALFLYGCNTINPTPHDTAITTGDQHSTTPILQPLDWKSLATVTKLSDEEVADVRSLSETTEVVSGWNAEDFFIHGCMELGENPEFKDYCQWFRVNIDDIVWKQKNNPDRRKPYNDNMKVRSTQTGNILTIISDDHVTNEAYVFIKQWIVPNYSGFDLLAITKQAYQEEKGFCHPRLLKTSYFDQYINEPNFQYLFGPYSGQLYHKPLILDEDNNRYEKTWYDQGERNLPTKRYTGGTIFSWISELGDTLNHDYQDNAEQFVVFTTPSHYLPHLIDCNEINNSSSNGMMFTIGLDDMSETVRIIELRSNGWINGSMSPLQITTLIDRIHQ